MKININSKTLKSILNKSVIVAPTVSHRPEFTGILIEAFDNQINFLTRSDQMDMIIEEKGNNFEVIEIGTMLVKAKTITEIANKVNDDETITLTKVGDNILVFTTSNSEYEINLLDDSNFEKINFNHGEEIETVNISKDTLKKIINSVVYAGNDKSPRRILQGVEISIKDNKISAIATDTMRVALYKTETNNTKEFSKIVPIKSLREMSKLIDSEEVTLSFELNKVFIKDKTTTIKTNIIEGNYPTVMNAFPTETINELRIAKTNIVDVIEKATLLNNNPNNPGIIKMIINNGTIKFETRQIEVGYASVETSYNAWKGNDIYQISFNPKFFLEAIKSIDNEEIIIKLNTSEQPFIITDEKEINKALILPFRTA